MSDRIRAHLRSNVVGYIALFCFAMSGTAIALDGTNTVFTDDITNGEVKSPDLGDGQTFSVDIKDGSVTGTDVADNNSLRSPEIAELNSDDITNGSLTGNDIADDSLGQVDLANDVIASAEVVNDSLTGNDVDESSLNLAAENWHEIGAGGEPPFNNSGFCMWKNFDTSHNSAAFLRDRHGFVHLKGLVNAVDVGTGCDFGFAEDRRIFTLPAGYRPVVRDVHVTINNAVLGRVNVDGVGAGGQDPGDVSIDAPTTVADAQNYVSLDGITFRCAPSGANGCP